MASPRSTPPADRGARERPAPLLSQLTDSLLLISLAVARFERGPRTTGPVPRAGVLAVAVVAATVPPFWAMEWRLDLAGFAWGAALLALAVLLARGRPGAAADGRGTLRRAIGPQR